MKMIASFAYDGQCYRCIFASPASRLVTLFVISNPRYKRILMVADFADVPRAGQYCVRPHKMLASQPVMEF